MAGREFGAQCSLWQFERKDLLAKGWLEPDDLSWQPDPEIKASGVAADWATAKDNAWKSIRAEIVELQMLMQDDRDRYLAEIDVQADGFPEYAIAFIGASEARYPWTIELIDCGLAIGNLVYSYYKQKFRRVRPSVLCPGLVPAFGPPAHPAFPSGHSFLGHFIALLLLEIPALRQRYGVFELSDGSPGKKVNPYPPPPSGTTVTISAADPAVVAWNSHGLGAGHPVVFRTSGALPRPITAGTIYYVLPTGLTSNRFQISDKVGGSAIDTSGGTQSGTHKATSTPPNPLMGRGEINSPLLWLGQRSAKNRERLGVHYVSDSMASRHLAAAVWRALLHDTSANGIPCPTLDSVLRHAIAEWPTKWPID